MNGKLSFFVYIRNRLCPSLVAKPFKVAICVGWCARDIERIKPFYSLLVFDDRALYFQLSEPLFLALTLVPMDLDEQTVPCCCVYTCQLQEVHPRWQQCHFGIPSSFTPDHTCRWKSQEHLWITRWRKWLGEEMPNGHLDMQRGPEDPQSEHCENI